MQQYFFKEADAEKIIEYYWPLLNGKQLSNAAPIVEMYKEQLGLYEFRVMVRATTTRWAHVRLTLEVAASRLGVLSIEDFIVHNRIKPSLVLPNSRWAF